MTNIPANRLKELREARGLSGEALGRLVNVNKGAVSKWENRVTELVGSRLRQVAEALMVHVDEIFQARPNPPLNHVADLRRAKGLDEANLAAALGWRDVGRIRILELATHIPQPICNRLSEVLGCGIFDLVDEPVPVDSGERAFLDLLRGLSDEDRVALFRHGDALTKSSGGGSGAG